MSKFLAYLRNDKGGAVEYVLVTAVVGGLILAASGNDAVKKSVVNLLSSMFSKADGKVAY